MGRMSGPVLLNLCLESRIDFYRLRLHAKCCHQPVTKRLVFLFSLLFIFCFYEQAKDLLSQGDIYIFVHQQRQSWTKAQDLITLDFGRAEIQSQFLLLRHFLQSESALYLEKEL